MLTVAATSLDNQPLVTREMKKKTSDSYTSAGKISPTYFVDGTTDHQFTKKIIQPHVFLLSNVTAAAARLLSDAAVRATELRGIEFGPDNVAAVADDYVILSCRTDGVANSNVRWYEYTTTSSIDGALISDGDLLLPSHPNAARYQLIRSNSVTFDLRINNITLADGGFYSCQDSNASPPSTIRLGAQLIVFGEDHSGHCLWLYISANKISQFCVRWNLLILSSCQRIYTDFPGSLCVVRIYAFIYRTGLSYCNYMQTLV